MALDKAVDSAQLNADLTAVADAIRTKGGTSAQLAFPDGFVSAVQAIEGAPDLQIVVTTSAGATVTATKGSKTVSGTADASGHCTLVVDESGTWSVTATAGGYSATADVIVGINLLELSLMPVLKPVFADNDWSAIIAACQADEVPDTWAVGNSKTMLINGVDYQIDIIGKNHDDYADGSGKAPITFGLHDCYADAEPMNSSNTNFGGWKNSAMRTTHLPAAMALMPKAVRNGIREVSKKTSAGSKSSTIEIVLDKLFLLSEVEIFGTTPYAAAGEGSWYQYYRSGGSTIKKQNGSASVWWERSPCATNASFFSQVSKNGSADLGSAGGAHSISFAFCF